MQHLVLSRCSSPHTKVWGYSYAEPHSPLVPLPYFHRDKLFRGGECGHGRKGKVCGGD